MSAQPPPVCSPDGNAWFLRDRDGTIQGPLSFDALTDAAWQGQIVSDMRVSHPDFTHSQWVLALEIPELAAAAAVSQAAAASDGASGEVRPAPVSAAAVVEKRRPGQLGKRIVLAATLTWLGGLPLASVDSSLQAHHRAAEQSGEPGLKEFSSLSERNDAALAGQSGVASGNLMLWSLLCGMAAAAGGVMAFAVPDRPWRPDLSS